MKDGFVILDKPTGITSRQAGARVARVFGADPRGAGHLGTLDPMASGLLVIALGQATKMIPFLESRGHAKEYLFSIKWGARTDTDDITGTVLEEGGRIPTDSEIDAVLSKFIGGYDQMPPAFSAKKVGGVPAYKLARKGKGAELKAKRVEICELDRHAGAGGEYRVVCGKGTYVRALARDIAAALGTAASCSLIRRTKTNGFDIKDAIKLEILEKMYNNGGAVSECLRPLDLGLDDIPVAGLETKDACLFRNGGFLPHGGAGLVRVYSGENFIGMGVSEAGVLKPKRIVNVDK